MQKTMVEVLEQANKDTYEKYLRSIGKSESEIRDILQKRRNYEKLAS